MQELLKASATTMASAIRCKQVSAVELLDAVLEQIAKVNPQLNAIVQLDAERARDRAKELDQLLAKGKVIGPFHGVPFTAKDSLATEGIITTLGTLGLKEFIPRQDATIIRRMKAAGAILLGKTNVPELCRAVETDNLVYGYTHNPYDLSRSAGGSSGGEAAIISACGSPFGIGSDLGGSLRIPAHYCGIATLRPSVGRVACSYDIKGSQPVGIRTGAEALLGVEGPLSRHVEDLFPMLKVIAGPDGVDPNVFDIPLQDPNQVDLGQLKIAYFYDNEIYPTDQQTIAAITNAEQVLREAGCQTQFQVPSFLQQANDLVMQLLGASQNIELIETALLAVGTKQTSDLLIRYLDFIRRGSHYGSNFQVAWDNWDYFRCAVTQYSEPFDVILCPVLPFSAINKNDTLWDEARFPAMVYCNSFSLAKYPVATVRIGHDNGSLPIGVQIITKPWKEHIALAVASVLEKSLGGWQPPFN